MDLNVVFFSLAVSSIYLLCLGHTGEGEKQPFIYNQYKSKNQGANDGGITNNWAYYETTHPQPYRGTRANLRDESLPNVQPGAMSLAAIRIYTGKHEKFTCIQAGWHVDPDLYNDSNTHLFVHWTNDGYQQTGCFNLACEGYTQVSKTVFPGQTIYPLSVIGGISYYIRITIVQDDTSGYWWLMYEKGQPEPVGFWRDSLVPSLSGIENTVGWGGWTQHLDNVESPPMGNGKFPEIGPILIQQASLISNIEMTNGNREWYHPSFVHAVSDDSICYKIGSFLYSKTTGYQFHYGGPGVC